MMTIRRTEERLVSMVRAGQIIGSVHPCLGQEAIPTAVCEVIGAQDPVIATYRGHGWALARGVPVVELIAEVMGRESRINSGRAGSAYLSGVEYGFYGENSIVGAGVPIAVGLGMAARFKRQDIVPVCSIGDGAMNQGAVHEALNLAAVSNIPMVLIVEHNGYVEMTPSADLTAVRAAERAAAYGMNAVRIDGNDTDAVAEAMRTARFRARTEQAPQLIEAVTYRLGGHYSGDAQQYRPEGEAEEWKRYDPIPRLAAELGLDAVRIDREVAEAVEAAFVEAAARPMPDPATVLRNVYA